MTPDFDNQTPSFTVKKNPTVDFFLSLSFLSLDELTGGGDVVIQNEISDLSFSYTYTNTTVGNNTINLQHAVFHHVFTSSAVLQVQYVLAMFTPWNATSSAEISLFNNTYTIYAGHPSCFFSLFMENWKFSDPSNVLKARVFVKINLSALSISTQETSTGFTLGLPYYPDYLLAKFPKVAYLDDRPVVIQPEYQINSISQPVSATFEISVPSFSATGRYSASMVTFGNFDPPASTLEVILIVVGVLVGVLVLLVILGLFLKYHSSEEEEEVIDPEERKRLEILSRLQYNSITKGTRTNVKFPIVGGGF
jgi:hypothetical protein